jgi:hypothetical protein
MFWTNLLKSGEDKCISGEVLNYKAWRDTYFLYFLYEVTSTTSTKWILVQEAYSLEAEYCGIKGGV